MLPKPDCVFAIPSLHDGLELDGRLHFPRRASQKTQSCAKAFAIIAHPYAPLGGCMDDPVVQAVGSKLLKSGFIVNTFNFRGAGDSAGRTSWTGNAELADYVSFIVHLLYFMNEAAVLDHVESHLLVLGGYSYGSLIASCIPDLRSLKEYIAQNQANPFVNEIALRAGELSHAFLGFIESRQQSSRDTLQIEAPRGSSHSIMIGGLESGSASRRCSGESTRNGLRGYPAHHSKDNSERKISTEKRQDERESTVNLSFNVVPTAAFLLVSPILPPVAGLITLFARPSFGVGQKDKSTDRQRSNLSENPSFVVFGSKDMFTSARKLKKWAQSIRSLAQSKLSYCEINEAGHFWREPGVEMLLQENVISWIAATTRQ